MVFTNIKTAADIEAEALAAAKVAKVAEIKAHYEVLGATMEHGGHTWQTDDKAIARLTATYTLLKAGDIPGPPEWRTANDQMVQMTTEGFLAFSMAVFAQQQATLAAMWAHMAAAEALETVEAVQAYDFKAPPEPA